VRIDQKRLGGLSQCVQSVDLAHVASYHRNRSSPSSIRHDDLTSDHLLHLYRTIPGILQLKLWTVGRLHLKKSSAITERSDSPARARIVKAIHLITIRSTEGACE
jgi:hypothetical protein